MLKIFNTFTRKKEIFQSIHAKVVNLYVCGVTIYDFCHIGHARTFIVFDMIVRYLKYIGFQVNYIRNITDIDDKIILQSLNKKINIYTFTNFLIQEMNKDFFLLDIIAPNKEPRVTDYINDIIKIIAKLINTKHAYINDQGDVVFSIASDKEYGSLSRQSLDALLSGARVTLNKMKKNPLDFILWKKSQIGDKIFWKSPWGNGRPGWHIECTAITNVLFQDSIDIHGGGSDLLFPHHENEFSQSRCLNNHFKINFWMHAGLVIVKNKKMSKSLGNSYFLKDILTLYHPEILRYFLLSTHYRHPIHYSEENIQKSQISVQYLYTALRNTHPIENSEEGVDLEIEFYEAMNNDFNTPKACSILFKLARKIIYLKNINISKSNSLAFRLKKLAYFLGLLKEDPNDFIQKKYFFNTNTIHKIECLIKERNIARKLKMWKKADQLRNKLFNLDVIVEDFPHQTLWRKK